MDAQKHAYQSHLDQMKVEMEKQSKQREVAELQMNEF
jgi:hypothetical protein